MKNALVRWGAALSFLTFLAGCKGCTGVPKQEDRPREPIPETRDPHPPQTDAGSYRHIFLEILQTKALPRSAQRLAHAQSFQYESDASELRIVGPSASPLGSYLIRQGARKSGINIQTPHGESDLKTREIAELLCQEQKYDSCSTNTMHRRRFDFAHEHDSPFQAFTEAIVTHDPKALIVQLHGFETSKRSFGPEQRARMILSTGHDSRALRAALASLQLDHDPTILVYGVTTHELGATRNAQAGLLKTLGKGHFLHIETSLEFRKKLQRDRKERDFLDRIIRTVKKKYDEQAH
jgi:hypothetical protein